MATKTTKLYLGSVLLVDLTTFALAGDLTTHSGNSTAHISAAERTAWNAKADAATLTAHTGNAALHVTASERTAWNAKLDSSALAAYATQAWTTTQLSTYASQSWVNTQIAAKHHIQLQPVDTLPATGTADVIYLTPAAGHSKNQYVWIENKWVQVGDTSVSLTGYATETWVDNRLKGYLKPEERYTNAEIDAAEEATLEQAKEYANQQIQGMDEVYLQAIELDQNTYDHLPVINSKTFYIVRES